MAWTTFSDVTARWVGPGIPTDSDLVETLIDDAEQVILASYPLIQDRIDDESLPLARVIFVVSQMVTRILRNPEGLNSWQQTTGPFSQSRSFGQENTGIYLTDSELSLLAPITRGKAFEVNLAPYATSADTRDSIWIEEDDWS